MPRKRSRADTEQRFQDAVLDLLAESGCGQLGVNLVAERTGSDKVLIYRYFGDFEGLLQRVAESRNWLPEAEALLPLAGHKPDEQLRQLYRRIHIEVRNDAPSRQIAFWRHSVTNPITERYEREWKTLWKELAEGVSRNMPYEDRKKWQQAIGLLALMTEAKTVGEPVDEDWLDRLATGLAPAEPQPAPSTAHEDMLPTNLL